MQFYKIFPEAITPMKAEKSALGSLPTAGFQYCEPVRTASSHGWLVFPPKDIVLKFDGKEVFTQVDGEWEALSHLYFDDDFWQQWDDLVPESMRGVRVPYLSTTFYPGLIQIWSGLLVETESGYSSHVRPIANYFRSSSYVTYEGIVRTDTHKPWPLFGNIRLTATDHIIKLDKHVPLFQIQKIQNECLKDTETICHDLMSDPNVLGNRFTEDMWKGFSGTVRDADATKSRRVGEYAAAVRKENKRD